MAYRPNRQTGAAPRLDPGPQCAGGTDESNKPLSDYPGSTPEANNHEDWRTKHGGEVLTGIELAPLLPLGNMRANQSDEDQHADRFCHNYSHVSRAVTFRDGLRH